MNNPPNNIYSSGNQIRTSNNQTDISKFIQLPQENELTIDNVRIQPAFMVFEDAYDGKHFNKRLTLRNHGKTTAFIRILSPKSHAFKINTLEKGFKLCPGLSIIRTVKYTHSIGNSELSYLPLVINGNEIDYNLQVKLSVPIISVEPYLIDFGEFATWQSPEVRTVKLKNTGSRSAVFAIDLGNNNLDLLVEPRRGVVSAGSEIILHIEVMGTKRGTFLQEFWVKCITPVRVQVSITFVEQKLFTYHLHVMTDFTMIDFPRTYFGTNIMKTMVLINNSPVSTMYCTKVLVGMDKIVTIKEAKERGKDIRCFKIWPEEGRLAPYEKKICEVIYTPIKTKRTRNKEQFENYAISFIQIEKVIWKEMFNVTFEDIFSIGDGRRKSVGSEALSLEDIIGERRNLSSLSTLQEFSVPTLKYMKSVTHIETVDIQTPLRVCLYGEGETTNVTLRPDAFLLGLLEVNETTERELLIFNNSQLLPITFKYVKIPFVEITPKQGVLLPEEGKEVLVKVTAGRMGVTKSKIVFELLHYNFPRKEGEYIVVGKKSATIEFEATYKNILPKKGMCGKRNLLTEEIKFTSKVDIPKSIMPIGVRNKYSEDNAFIAFPDDRPFVLRPWRKAEEIKTIFARMPRNRSMKDQYTLSNSEEELRKRNRDYYQEYTRTEAQKLRNLYKDKCKQVSDYDTTNPKKIFFTDFKPQSYKDKEVALTTKKPSFIPLTPSELYNISVFPFIIQLEGIVPESFANTAITVKNNNEFSIRVYINPKKYGVLEFPEGNRKIIRANTEQKIPIKYNAEGIGNHYVAIEIIVNESHGCECILQTKVIPGFVTVNVSHLEFVSTESPRKYIKLTNPCNEDVTFNWENNTKSLNILPSKGTIPAKSFMYCKILYIPAVTEKLASEIILTSDNNKQSKILIDVFATLVKPKVAFSIDHLEIPIVPLNIPIKRRLTLRNFGNENVLFNIINPTPIYGISVAPSQGILRGYGDQIFNINICVPTCITFSCTVEIDVQLIDKISFKISGSVEYPQVIVKPENFNLRKVYLGCFDKFKFQVENIGRCLASIQFNFEYYPEFYVSTDAKKDSPVLKKKGILLEPQERKVLYLHFYPIDVAPNSFHLPIIINNILGPSSKIRMDTLSTNTYLGPGVNFYHSEQTNVIEYPAKLRCTEVSNTVLCPVLEFSELRFKFYKYTHVNLESVDSLVFFVTNVSNTTATFSIHLDDRDPFCLKHLEGGTVNSEGNRIIITLNSKDEAILNAVFLPISPGEYINYFPVYLEGMEDEPYNYIIMHGNLYAPTIEVPDPVVYMLPVPLGITCESHFTAILRYHGEICSFSNQSQSTDLLVSVYREKSGKRRKEKDAVDKLQVNVFHTTSNAVEYATQVILECSCGAFTKFTVKGVVDNCILTTHIFRNVYCVKDADHFDSSSTRLSTICTKFIPSDESIYSDTFSCVFPTASFFDRRLDCSSCSFPLFPSENEPTYLKYMYKCLRTLELYLHKQYFYGKRFCKIPDDICVFPIQVEIKDKKNKAHSFRKKKKQSDLLYLQILAVIAGRDILNKIKPQGDYPTDEIKRINYTYTIYRNTFNHLKLKHAMLSHVQAEHLLQYDDYVVYMKKIKKTEDNIIHDEDTFFRYSAQSWIDLLLQTFKVYVLSNIKLPKRIISGAPLKTTQEGTDIRQKLEKAYINWERISEMTAEDIEPGVYGKNEVILLAWFRFIFHEYHSLLFTHESLNLKRFSNFRDNFLDFLALTVLTAVYCPYLYNDLKNINVPPKTYEEAFHNACVVILAWGKVNISYHLNPTELLVANEMQLVLLSIYLYQVLPSLRPSETIVLKAPLSQTISKQISLKNTTNEIVVYQVLFFENEKGYFTANAENITIGPKQTGSVTITFFAKKLLKTRCVLLLSGEVPGIRYAKNVAYYIEGVPDISYYEETNHKQFTPYLYEYLTKAVDICSPYKVETSYNIYVHHGVPEEADICNAYKHQNVGEPPIPKIIYISNKQLTSDKDGNAVIFLSICTMSTLNADFYIYCLSEEAGDFCVRIRVEPITKRNKIYQVISVVLPRGFLDFPCYCTDSHSFSLSCPKTLIALIPSRNISMWSCTERMFVQTLGTQEFHFWKKYLGTSAGVHLLRKVIDAYKDEKQSFVEHTFNETVEYSVILDSDYKNKVTVIPEIIIENTHSTDKMEFPIHLNNGNIPPSFFCNFKSKDGLEYRYYKIIFITDSLSETYDDKVTLQKIEKIISSSK